MTQKKQVLHSDGTQDAFRPDIIRQYLIQETEIDENLRERIVQSISRKINGLESDLVTTVQLRAEVTSRLTSENIEEEPFVIVTESDIMSLLLDYDRNNANQVRSAGALEYSLFEMVAKRYMTTQYSPEWREAVQYGLVYPHDAAQELYKGLNCFMLNSRFIFKKGLRTYGDNGLGAVSAPPKHFDTALELIEQTLGLATSYIAGGVAAACFSVFLAPFITGLSDKEIKQSLQGFLFQCNQAFKNRGCVAGDTEIWVKINGYQKLMTFRELSDLIGAEYGKTDIKDFDIQVLTVTNDKKIKWMKATIFWRNEPQELYQVRLPKGRSFKCDKNHGLISFKNLNSINILDIKKGTQLCDPIGINPYYQIEKNDYYWQGCLYGFWLGDGYKHDNNNRTTITVGKPDKILFLDNLFSKIHIDVNRTISNKKIDEKHLIGEYVNYHFDKSCLVSEEDMMENADYLAGLITGMLSSDGNMRVGSTGFIDVQFQNTNMDYVNLLRYALYYFGIRCNKNIKESHSLVYRLNVEASAPAMFLYNQLELRSLFKDAFLKCRQPNKYDDKVKRMRIKSVSPTNEKEETFCFTVNGRMIIGDGFILTNNSQSMFSSVCLDLEMPEFLLEQDAIGPGGQVVGKYKDFQKENKKIIKILTEVAIEGDAEGKALFFPNLIYNIDNADLNEWPEIFDLSAKFSSPYFCSAKANGTVYQSTLGCRSALPANWTGDPNIDCMGTGNSVYTTVNLPAVALKSKSEDIEFFELLSQTMDLVREYNLNRLDWIKKLWYDYKVADFMIQEDEDGVPLYRLEDATIVCGYLGLSEALEILGYGPIYESNEKAREIMIFMRDKIAKWKKEDKLRWGLFQTPAENAALKLSQKMIKKYGFRESHVKGTKEASFYTNSNHVPVDADIDLINRIKIEGNNQPLGPAGNIMNIYLGESYSEGSALKVLCEKIRDETDAYFWAFTGDYSICPKCHSKFKGAIGVCPNCGSHTNTISRVTGYQTVVEATWNPGKQSEFKVRKRY